MKFLKYDLGNLDGGDTVIVKLSGSAANVRLLTAHDFHQYKAGRQHRYYGGYVTRSPHRIPVPHAGSWYVVIDSGGYRANITASVNVLRGKSRILPAAQSALPTSSLAEIAHNLSRERHDTSSAVIHDVLLSHATEDKAALRI